MRSWILVAVILQLVITGIKTDRNYDFGDIIEFPREKCGATWLSHFAIYVGPETGVNVGQGDNDIFHRTGAVGKPDCTFGKLTDARKSSKDVKKNYLDTYFTLKDISPDVIAERIRNEVKSCGKYRPFARNCEHLATKMRYGVSLTLQRGTVAGCAFKLQMNHAKREEIEEKIFNVRRRDRDFYRKADENNNTTLCEAQPG